jgi:hypothetical protein
MRYILILLTSYLQPYRDHPEVHQLPDEEQLHHLLFG